MHRFTHPLMRHPRPAINPPPVVDSPQDGDSGVGASSNPLMPGSFPENDNPPTPYQPSVLDVLVAKAMMIKALTLPLELVNRIIDFAEYWPHTSAQLDYGATPHPVARGSSPQEDVFLVSKMHKSPGSPSRPSACAPRLTSRLLSWFPAAYSSPWLRQASEPRSSPLQDGRGQAPLSLVRASGRAVP